LPEVAVVHSGLAPSLQVSKSQGSEDARNGTSPQEVVMLPVSAFEAGFLPSKPGKIHYPIAMIWVSPILSFVTQKLLVLWKEIGYIA